MNNKGFSLIEMVMVIVLVSIIAGFTAAALLEGTEGWLTVVPRKDAMSEVRMAMERMVREMREGRRYYHVPASGSSSSLTFRQYTSKYQAAPGKEIIYQFSGGSISRTATTEGTATLAGDIAFCNFSVYKPNLIRIRLGSTISGKTVELRDLAFFRNYTGKE